MQRASEGGCFLETVALGGAARWRRFDSATSWRSTFLMQKGQRAYPHPAACARCASSASHMSPVPPALGEDALRTVLNVGLHHSCRLHRGGCNPILFGGAAAQPVRRKRALLCALTRSPLHSSPFSAECHPLFSPHLFTPCSVRRLVGGAHAQTHTHTHTHTYSRLRDRRIALFTHRPSPSSRRRDTTEICFYFLTRLFWMPSPGESTACTPVRWRARACSHQRRRRIYLRVRCPHTVRAVSPARTHARTPPIATEEQRGENTPDYKDGVLRHFKDDFLQSE